MEEPKILPRIILVRAEQILQQRLKVCYRLSDDDPNLIKCELLDGSIQYVDLKNKEVVDFTSLQITIEDAEKDDTYKLTGKEAETVLHTDDMQAEYETEKSADKLKKKIVDASTLEKVEEPKKARKPKTRTKKSK